MIKKETISRTLQPAVATIVCLIAALLCRALAAAQSDVPIGRPFSAQGTISSVGSGLVVTGRLMSLRAKQFVVAVPKGPGAPTGRVLGPIAENARISLQSSRIDHATAGDTIEVRGVRFEGQDVLVQQAKIVLKRIGADQLAATGKAASNGGTAANGRHRPAGSAGRSTDRDRQEARYAALSDAPGKPRTVRSQNFIMYTDVSDRSGQILLDKLELSNISGTATARTCVHGTGRRSSACSARIRRKK